STRAPVASSCRASLRMTEEEWDANPRCRFGGETTIKLGRNQVFFAPYSLRGSVIFYLFAVAVEVAFEFDEGIAPQLFKRAACQRKRDHGLGGDAGCGDDADIGAFVSRLHGFAGGKIDRFQRPPQGRDRLEIAADDDVFSIRDSTFDSTGVVLRAGKAGV